MVEKRIAKVEFLTKAQKESFKIIEVKKDVAPISASATS
jgi:hypothetical protein